MLSILINAYACSPNMGSEPGMAWNWCVNLAKHCELHIITEGEFKDEIERVVSTLPQGVNMHFYYNPVSDNVRKMCWNQGDWRFYIHYKKWQKSTCEIAKRICKEHHIDILHQLNMIGFREPGYLWSIEDKPFVWGPIGGLKQFPEAYLIGSDPKTKFFNKLKNRINLLQLKYDKRVCKALNRASVLISSIPDSHRAILKYHKLDSIIIPETGCYTRDRNKDLTNKYDDLEEFKILWVGKFDFRKQLNIALESIAQLKQLKNIKLQICGTGSAEQVTHYTTLAKELGISHLVEWCGSISNGEVLQKMEESHLFFFTSVNEDTSTVVLESLSSQLPVLCFNTCGFGPIINSLVGAKIELSNPKQSVEEFAHKIGDLYNDTQSLKQMSLNCIERQRELSWDNKALQMIDLYNKALTQ